MPPNGHPEFVVAQVAQLRPATPRATVQKHLVRFEVLALTPNIEARYSKSLEATTINEEIAQYRVDVLRYTLQHCEELEKKSILI